MKKILVALFLLPFLSMYGQYGDQTPVVISNITCLIHIPTTYNTEPITTKHPLLVMLNGAGEYGTNPAKATVHGTGWAIKNNKWDGTAANPNTGLIESYIVISTINPNNTQGLSTTQIDAIQHYAITNYRVDTTVKAMTGLSRGGGGTWGYSIHLSGYNWGTSPPTPLFFTPQHIPTSIIVASSESNYYDPVQYFIQDGTWAWGFGDLVDGDSHAVSTQANMDSIKKYTNPDRAIFTTYRCTDAGRQGHCGWDDSIYDASVTRLVDGIPMNIYQFPLYHRKGTVAPPTNTIATGNISTPICINSPSGYNVSIPFTSIGTYTSNTYTAQLSDKNGVFSSATNIGTLVSNGNSGSIPSIIPISIPSGTKYRVRVISSNPPVTGTINNSDITINIATNSISPTSTQNISVNTNGAQLSVKEGSTPISRQWLSNNVAITGQTGVNYTPNFVNPGTYTITCNSTFTCGVITSNSVTIVVTASLPHKVYINSNGGGTINLNGCDGSFKYNHGDSLIFKSSSKWSRIELHCIDSVTLLNEGGATNMGDDYGGGNTVILPGGFIFDNCNYIHLTGTGAAGVTYGFLDSSNNNRGVGIQIVGNSNYIEIDHVEVFQRNAGLWDKTEQLDNKCNPNLAFPNMVMHDHKIHDNYIHKMLNEGMYIGPTAPNSNDTTDVNNQHPKVYCPDGTLNTTLTSRMGNIEVYNNIVDSTGRGGIQLASCDSGKNSIHHNIVTRSGYSGTYGQGNGIIIGGYTHVDVFNNIVRSTSSTGIFTLGSGLNRIFNNTIDSSGIKRDGTVSANTPLIEIDTRNVSNPSPGHANPELLTFQVYDNNFLLNSSNYDIVIDRTYNTFDPTGSYICGNSRSRIYNFYQVPYSTNCGVPSSVTMGTLPASPYCAGFSFSLPFTSIGTFNSDNQYLVKLSDKNGSFASPVTIGTLPSTLNTGNIPCTIPTNIITGTGYKIRLESTSPILVSSVSSNLTINSPTNSISPTAEQDIETGSSGVPIVIFEGMTATSRQWKSNGSNIAGQTGTSYTPIFNTAGTYTITCTSSFGSCGNITSNSVTIVVTDPVPPPPQTIATGVITNTNICVKATSGFPILVPFTSIGTYGTNNQYKAVLSNKTGGFASGVTIGTIQSNANSGTISAIIPAGIISGTNYRVRVVSTNPKVIGSNNGTSIVISSGSNSISPSSPQTIEKFANGNTLTVQEGSTPLSRQWYEGNNPISGATSSTLVPNFIVAGIYNITCHSIFSGCGEIVSNPVQITVTEPISPPPPDSICYIIKTQPRDTIVEKIFHLTTKVPIYGIACDTFHFIFIKFVYNCHTSTTIIGYRDSAYDSLGYIHQQTISRDSLVCTASYKIGAFYFSVLGNVSIAKQIDTVKNYLGLRYIRLNITRGGGASWNVKQANDSGMHVIQTINNSSDGAAGWGDYLSSLYNIATPEVVSIRNEESVNATSIPAYLSDLQIAIDTSHAHGVKVTNGGATGDIIYSMVDWMQHNDKVDSANTLISSLHLDMNSSEATTAIAKWNILLPAYRDMALDYINVHGYEPPRADTTATTVSGLLPIVINYIRMMTGNKPIMTNEMGTQNHNYNLLNDFIVEWINIGARYIIYFDGDGTQAVKNQDYFRQIVQSIGLN